MFTFIGPVHLPILSHHHNNIHNDTDNNNITVSAAHTQRMSILSPTPLEVALYATILYHALQGIYTIEKAALSNNFL